MLSNVVIELVSVSASCPGVFQVFLFSIFRSLVGLWLLFIRSRFLVVFLSVVGFRFLAGLCSLHMGFG